MNYLAIVQELHELAGCSGPLPATVSGATGETLRLVNWVRRAWDMIQARSTAWGWVSAGGSPNWGAGYQASRICPELCWLTSPQAQAFRPGAVVESNSVLWSVMAPTLVAKTD